MGRLIDADALTKNLEWYCDPARCDSYDGVRCRACLLSDALTAIEDAPEADPVLHAEWLYDRPGHWFCSNCHLTEGWASKWMKYCPQCGAKMDKENCDE